MASLTRFCLRRLSTTTSTINRLTIIGGGLMGSGIAQVAAQTGHHVTLVDQNEAILTKSQARIAGSLEKIAKKKFPDDVNGAERFTAESLGRLSLAVDVDSAVTESDLVIEAIVENIDAKHKLFSAIDKVAPKHTIFASNTSSLKIHDIAVATDRPDRFGGLHFFNPVPVMKLLEVIRTPDTSDTTFNTLLQFGKNMGKTTVNCKDTPGFIVNRLLVPFIMEAVRMVERGDATPQDIDTAMKLGASHPMGPLELQDYIGIDTIKFIVDGDATPEDVDTAIKLGAGHIIGPLELADFVGLDTATYIAHGWHTSYPDNPLFNTSTLIDKLVSEGKLGRKSGEGIYKYDAPEVAKGKQRT